MGRTKKLKINTFIRAIPFLSIFFILVLLSFSNQDKYAKLRILIWDTPSLSLVNYLAISSVTGFFFSYAITSKLSKFKQPKVNKIDNELFNSTDDNTNDIEYNDKDYSYTNTLIERDINQPSPTLNANFRVIGKTSRKNPREINDDHYVIEENIYADEKYNQNNTQNLYYENESIINKNDWNDDSFTKW